MKSIFDGTGYFRNDDRPSGGKLSEGDVLGCSHCQQAMPKAEWKLNGGICFICAKPLCLICYERTRTFGCEVFEKNIEHAVADLYRRQQNAKILGI